MTATAWTEARDRILAHCYLQEKLPREEIAMRLGITVGCVRKRLAELGLRRERIVTPPRSGPRMVREAWLKRMAEAPLAPLAESEIARLRRLGMPLTRIAAQLRLSYREVVRAFDREARA